MIIYVKYATQTMCGIQWTGSNFNEMVNFVKKHQKTSSVKIESDAYNKNVLRVYNLVDEPREYVRQGEYLFAWNDGNFCVKSQDIIDRDMLLLSELAFLTYRGALEEERKLLQKRNNDSTT